MVLHCFLQMVHNLMTIMMPHSGCELSSPNYEIGHLFLVDRGDSKKMLVYVLPHEVLFIKK